MIDVRLLCGRWWAGGESCGLGWKPILLVTVGKCDSICPRVTTSISHPWLEASTSNPLVLGTGFQPAVLCYYHCAEDYVHGYSEYRPPAYAVVVDCRLCSGVLQLSSSYARG